MEGEFIGGCDILLQMHQSGELGIIFKSFLLNFDPSINYVLIRQQTTNPMIA